MTQVTGYIKRLDKKGQPSKIAKKHEETLKVLGYDVSVSENGEDLVVKGSRIEKGEIDLTDHETALKTIKSEIIQKKALLSYGGTFLVKKNDGDVRSLPGNFALGFLDKLCTGLSCIVVKDKPSEPKKKASFSLDDLLG